MATGVQMARLDGFETDYLDQAQNFIDDPLGFVYWAFPWGLEGPLAEEEGPDDWQADILDRLGTASKTKRLGEEMPAIMLAVSSGHGIGKTALVCWIIIWFICTRYQPQIVVTANTVPQLTNKTWRELSKWQRICIMEPILKWTSKKLHIVGRADSWFAAATPWQANVSEGFAGTHEDSVLVIFDEASKIDDSIWEVAEGALTDREAFFVAFGNPTQNQGRFRECFRRDRKYWITAQIDSRTTKRANKAQIAQWAERYGEDSDFFRIRVRGIFPRSGEFQFMDEELVYNAIERHVIGWESFGTILSVDVGRGKASGDPTKVLLRQGPKIHYIKEYTEIDEMQCVGIVSRHIQDDLPDGVVLDSGGLGAGVYSRLAQLGFKIFPYLGGYAAVADKDYYNFRTECYDLTRSWLKTGSIPDEPLLVEDLTSPTYAFDNKNRIQLEVKEDLVDRMGRSPDAGDALAMSFAIRVPNKTVVEDTDYMETLLAKYQSEQGTGGQTWMSR